MLRHCDHHYHHLFPASRSSQNRVTQETMFLRFLFKRMPLLRFVGFLYHVPSCQLRFSTPDHRWHHPLFVVGTKHVVASGNMAAKGHWLGDLWKVSRGMLQLRGAIIPFVRIARFLFKNQVQQSGQAHHKQKGYEIKIDKVDQLHIIHSTKTRYIYTINIGCYLTGHKLACSSCNTTQ